MRPVLVIIVLLDYGGFYHNNYSCSTNSNLEECFTSVSSGKTIVASAITGKGISTNSDATFQTMANNINIIKNSATIIYCGSVSHGSSINLTTYYNGDWSIISANSIYMKNIKTYGSMGISNAGDSGYGQSALASLNISYNGTTHVVSFSCYQSEDIIRPPKKGSVETKLSYADIYLIY